MAARLSDDTATAPDQETVVVPGTGAILPSPAKSPAAVHEQRRAPENQIEALLEAHPLGQALTSLPSVGVRSAAVLLVTIGRGSSFQSAAHLASYAGLAPTTKQPGTSIHGEHTPRGGNRSPDALCSSPRAPPSTTPPPPSSRFSDYRSARTGRS